MKPEQSPFIPNSIYDRLYGEIPFAQEDLRLFQTKELARLRHVSLSAVPTWTLPTGICATKFEHSVGVAHLARIVAQKPEFNAIGRNLFFAALAHDIGTPPFSHTSEWFQHEILGANHEEFARTVVENSEFGSEIERQGGSVEKVLELVNGEGEFGDLMNGSIDLDNLDNSLRFCLSSGILTEPAYSPERLADAFTVCEGELALDPSNGALEHLQKWEDVRKITYGFVYSPHNLSSAMMTYRALSIAFEEGELHPDYFLYTDTQALRYLSEECNPRTQALMERAARWQYYPRVYERTDTGIPDTKKHFYLDHSNRLKLSDELARVLKVGREDVSVYVGKDKGYKKVHLPIIGHNGREQHDPTQKLRWMAQVYVRPELGDRAEVIAECMNDALDNIPDREIETEVGILY